jgi:hypothetical protein
MFVRQCHYRHGKILILRYAQGQDDKRLRQDPSLRSG